MRRGTKITLWVIASVALIAVLSLLGLTMIFGSNLVAGLYSLVFERQPTMEEMLGTYVFHGDGRPSTIRLLKDGLFVEQIDAQSASARTISGRWNYRYQENYADLDFRPFEDPRTNGKHNDDYNLLCYKPRFGKTYLQLDPDTGDEFKKQDTR